MIENEFDVLLLPSRQLGEYKRSVRNMRHPEGCIAQQYLMHESVTFTRMYLNRGTSSIPVQVNPAVVYNLSVVSQFIEMRSVVRGKKLTTLELFWAHWTVTENCEELQAFVDTHETRFNRRYPNGVRQLKDRVKSFNYNFSHCVSPHIYT